MKLKLFSLLLAVAASIGTMFASVAIDGLNYNLNETWKTAEVARSSCYGDIVIPASVSYFDVSYSVTSIGDAAFSVCSALTSVTIPNSVTSIGENAFALCSGLTSIEIPNSVSSIGNYAFEKCRSLTSVTIGNSVTSIGDQAFSGCSGITFVIWNAKNCSNSGGFGSQVESFVFGSEVETIPASCCEDMNKLTSLTIPNTVTSIGNGAFYKCKGLTKVNITDIAAWCNIAFSDNGSNPLYYVNHLYVNDVEVTNLVIPEGVTSIGDYAFYDCTGLTSVTIPNSVTSIGYAAFGYCSSLTSVHIFDIAAWCAISFGDNPLFYAHNLYLNGELVTDLVIPEGVTSIGDDAFSDCYGLTSVTIPNSVTSIGNGAFYKCKGLTSITIPNSVTSIGEYAFFDCSSLTSVTIPNSVTSIGDYAFFDCSSLTSIVVENGNSVYDSRNNCNAIIETATNTLIAGCQNTIIPNSVTSIGDWAFGYCSGLTSVTIGNSVTSIGEYAFYYCSGLISVTIEAETPPTLVEEAFYYTNNCPIYVPCNAVNAYKTAWSEYADRIVANCASYTITFVNWDGNELLKLTGVENGTMPVYTGNTPTRPDDAFYTYTFKGWSPNIVEATQDATYVAVYDEHPRTTDIKEVSAKTNVVKILRNGQLYILRNGKAYSVQGQEVK